MKNKKGFTMIESLIIAAIVLCVVLLVTTGCAIQPAAVVADNTPSYQKDSANVEKIQQKVSNSVPVPEITMSAERKNIAERAKVFDNESKITYIYLINYGKVMAFYTVSGKVSSLNSYMVPLDKLVYADGTPCSRNKSYGGSGAASWEPCYVVSTTDIDGAYGDNADGIFFFTTEGAYVEWKGDYMVSDQPLKLTQQPELVREIK